MEKRGCMAIFLLVLIVAVISVAMTAGLIAIACWAFGWTFSWKMAIGVYAVICLLNMIFGGASS